MMSASFLDEQVVAMPPIGMAALGLLGEAFLRQMAPDTLKNPGALDVRALVEITLPEVGIHVAPASSEELGDRHGATDPSGQGEINILLSEELWNDLMYHGTRERMARSTVIHEVCHALLHVPIVRRRLNSADPERLLLARQTRGSLPAYRDPEWQAWALCGAIMMPVKTMKLVLHRSPREIATLYGVNEVFLRKHAKRTGLQLTT